MPADLRALEGFVLGDSWAIPTIDEREELENTTKNDESTASGPELIMPSIHDESSSSWVMPTMRRRNPKKSTPIERPPEEKPKNEFVQQPVFFVTKKGLLRTTIIQTINLLLISAILGLLVIPELIYQNRHLCDIQTISSIYASSCNSPPTSTTTTSHEDSATTPTTTTTRLETLFTRTLQITPHLVSALKHSDSALRATLSDLLEEYPGAKNSLDLELSGCWHALRTVTQELDSLQVDLKSAVDSLVALQMPKYKIHDSRLATTQMLQREEYLQRLGYSIQTRADSLAMVLVALEDHLRSIEGIVIAAEDESGERNYWSATFTDFIMMHIAWSNTAVDACKDLCRLRHAAKHHRPVMRLVRNLSMKLQNQIRS